MIYLVIPDCHGRKFWRTAIANNIDKVDKVIFLGDYLDPYQEEIMTAPELMECNDFYDSQNLLKMLEDIVSLKKNEPNKYILLTGNHSDSYIWSKFHSATRTDYKNWEKYHKFFSQNLEYFNLVWTEGNCIFSHAGISEEWSEVFAARYNIEFKSLLGVAKILQNISVDEIHNSKTLISLLGMISFYRGGDYNNGSCEWADIREHLNLKESTSDKIIGYGPKDIFQVFGHTQLKAPLISDRWACLDCRQGFIFNTETYECNSCV